MRIGAQMYTLRDYCKTTDDLYEMLARVREIGYETVQISGTCAYEAEWMKTTLEKLDLKCVLTHISPDKLLADPLQVAKEHDVFGCKYIGLGMMPNALKGGYHDYQSFEKNFRPVAEAFKWEGHLLMYHNHDIEFAKTPDGQLYLDKMAEDFAPDLLGFTLDTYWVQHGGGDPAEYLKKLHGRIPCVHFKDMVYSLEDRAPRMAAVGEGNINFEACLKACFEGGTEYILVEQDYCYDEHPLICLKKSYDYLKSMGLR